MLSLGDLMVGRFDFKAHLLECEADVTAAVLAAVNGAEVEITALVVSLSGGLSVFVDMEQEEFALRTDIARIAHIRRFLYRAAQDIARVALKGSAVRIEHIFFDELLGSERHVHRLFLKTLSDSAPAAVNDGSDSKLCFCHFSVILSMLFKYFQKALICARPFVGVARSIFA